MIELTPKARRALRAQAHHLHPVVTIGQHGLTPQVLHEIDLALRAHGLIKVRVFSEDRKERDAMLARIAEELDAAPIQHLGKLLIVWRPVEEAAPATKTAVKSARRRVAGGAAPRTSASTEREPRAFSGAARRGRGGASTEGARAHERLGDGSRSRSRRRHAHSEAQGIGTARRTPRGGSAGGTDKKAGSDGGTRRRTRVAPRGRAPTGKSAPNPRRRRRVG